MLIPPHITVVLRCLYCWDLSVVHHNTTYRKVFIILYMCVYLFKVFVHVITSKLWAKCFSIIPHLCTSGLNCHVNFSVHLNRCTSEQHLWCKQIRTGEVFVNICRTNTVFFRYLEHLLVNSLSTAAATICKCKNTPSSWTCCRFLYIMTDNMQSCTQDSLTSEQLDHSTW